VGALHGGQVGTAEKDDIFESGRVVADRYRILRLLGQGGMGVVYEAEHIALEKRMALKVLTPERSGKRESISRLLKEARSTASIGHPGIVEIFDVNVEEDVAFIGMELLKGEELSQRIHRDAPLDESLVIQLGVELADAVAAAHEHGITHRDLKPDNIFLVERRRNAVALKILDFGLAKLAQPIDAVSLQTQSSDILGTPLYMSPEQMVSSKNVDGRTDIYAMGVILYECLAGSPPYNPESFASLVLMVTSEDPSPLAELRPDISPKLVAIVEKAMARDKEDRFQTATALADALLDLQGEGGGPLPSNRTGRAVSPPPSNDEIRGMPSDPLAPGELPTLPSDADADAGTLESKEEAPAQAAPAASLEPSVRSAPATGSRHWLPAVGALAVALLLVAAFLLWPDSEQEQDDSTTAIGGGTVAATTNDTGTAPGLELPVGDADLGGISSSSDGGGSATRPRRVHFTTTPPGAEIHVDGEVRCTTPCDAELGTEPVTITASLRGHETGVARLEPPFPDDVALTLQRVRRPTGQRPTGTRQGNDLPPLRAR